MKSKRCTKCGKTRLIKFFTSQIMYRKKGNRIRLHSWCHACKRYNRQNLTVEQQFRKHFNHKIWHLKTRYKITLEEYLEKLKNQNYLCDICKVFKHQDTLTLKGFKAWVREGRPAFTCLAVDHDHETDEVRGLVCNTCNTAYGLLRENAQTIKGMLHYHKKWRKAA